MLGPLFDRCMWIIREDGRWKNGKKTERSKKDVRKRKIRRKIEEDGMMLLKCM
jgi:hypothetical protein